MKNEPKAELEYDKGPADERIWLGELERLQGDDFTLSPYCCVLCKAEWIAINCEPACPECVDNERNFNG